MRKILVICLFLAWCVMAIAQSSGAAPASQSGTQTVSRSTRAINYRQATSAKVELRGTELMPRAAGEAKVQSRPGRTEIEIKVAGLEEATKFGLEYLTYVAWALSPQGRAANLGELALDKGAGKIKATTELQTFGMIVTAEPYFAVTQPSNLVVLENAVSGGAGGEAISFSYQLLAPGAYSSSNERIKDAISAWIRGRRWSCSKPAMRCVSRVRPVRRNMPARCCKGRSRRWDRRRALIARSRTGLRSLPMRATPPRRPKMHG